MTHHHLRAWIAQATAVIAICAGVSAQDVPNAAPPGLAPEAQHAIAKAYPDALIQEANLQDDEVKYYDVQLNDGGREFLVRITADGTVLEVETYEHMKALPADVAATITAALPKGAKVVAVTKREVRARIRDEHVVPCTPPKTRYEVEYVGESARGSIEFGPNKAGRLVVKSRSEETVGEDGDAEE
ncbi:MAG: hypothetical protein A3K19_22430 [Lentisphaerae bacterium RIFOXYB12_FULL_65_16]|nr:MAG: hypothetical protein A3K18_09850 [Lentisphaerae bacterium RIFOXYA12_64_32]OGV91854.1 MAG: hypothetical protein A3K19_22430 [Lentisphaerae bacterium RIFOXYB12_FULL_65_16]